MHVFKRRIDNLVTNMCMHENDDNDDGHNCHQQNGTDIDVLKKCVSCTKHGKKKKIAYFLTILYMVLTNFLKQ